MSLQINYLELLVILYVLRGLLNSFCGKSVLLRADNDQLSEGGEVNVAWDIHLLAQSAQITARVKHIPGERNALADIHPGRAQWYTQNGPCFILVTRVLEKVAADHSGMRGGLDSPQMAQSILVHQDVGPAG